MISGGNYNTCVECGRVYPEGCCRGTLTCSHKCEEKRRIRLDEHKKKVKIEIAAAEYRKCPDYQI